MKTLDCNEHIEFLSISSLQKNLDMKRKNVGTRESLNASSTEDLSIYKKIVEQKWNNQTWRKWLKKLSSELIGEKC